MRLAWLCLLAASPALASPGTSPETSPETSRIAIGTNIPLRGLDALAGSLYVGLSEHHAVRGNLARYPFGPNAAGELFVGLASGEGSEGSYSGTITDLGAAWSYFPRRVLDGFFVEAGLLARLRDHRVVDDYAPDAIVETDTRTAAARATIGWSWLIDGHVFVSLAVGVSAGYERGRERTATHSYPPMEIDYTSRAVSRTAIEPEGFLRIGGAFDL